jgi:hypothetical protein
MREDALIDTVTTAEIIGPALLEIFASDEDEDDA